MSDIEKKTDTLAESNIQLPSYWTLSFAWPWVLGSVVICWLINFLLVLAGVNIAPPWSVLLRFHPLDSAARGQAIVAATGLVAGYITLLTFCINYHQKHYFQGKQTETEDHKLEAQRAQSNFDAIAKEYDALSKDFVSGDELGRINAAIGLAAVAKKADPRIQIPKYPTDRPAVKTSNIYPWYERVAKQLASTLIIYDEPRARAQVRNSIRDIAAFDDVPGQQPLLTFLINQLADANRTAYKTFLETFAEGMACDKPNHLQTFARAVTIFDDPKRNEQMLTEFKSDPDYMLLLEVQKDIRKYTTDYEKELAKKREIVGDPDANFLRRLRTRSHQLVETRDAITDCVQKGVRNIGVELPTPDEAIWENEFRTKEFKSWKKDLIDALATVPKLTLDRVFVQGAFLNSAQLQDSNLSYAQLQGAELYSAQLQGAFLINAKLQGSDLGKAQVLGARLDSALLQYTNLTHAILQGADVSNAHLNYAKLGFAKLQGAVLYSAQLNNATLMFAKLRGANLNSAQLEDAVMLSAQLQCASLRRAQLRGAKLDSAQVHNTKLAELEIDLNNKTPGFRNVNWGEADFYEFVFDGELQYEVHSNERNKELIQWFRKHYPDGGPKEGELWPDGEIHSEDYAGNTPEEPTE